MQKYKIIRPLSGDGIYLAECDGQKVVLKRHRYFDVEAKMLEYLAPYLNVPGVVEVGSDCVVMEYVQGGGRVDEAEAARAVAALHGVGSKSFGLHFDTTIGPYFQPNMPAPAWIPFYRDLRVMQMARGCMEQGRFGSETMRRIETLCGRMETFLFEPQPSLLHGDIWGGNVMRRNGAVCFIDPAIYYGHNEVELAFIMMFNTFGDRFFESYREIHPIEKGFFSERAHLYMLYPVLVHVRSFGSSYRGMLESVLSRFE